MKIRLLYDRILVKHTEAEEVRSGGIIIPDIAKGKPQEGTVIAVGDGKLLEDGQRAAVNVKPGDRVLFGKHSGSEMTIEDEKYLILREEDILGILKESAQL